MLPLVTGVRTVGPGACWRPTSWAPTRRHRGRRAPSVAGHAALRLETALLFDDVRSFATAEERQRLAREIHDGIAQELVMVGYGIDNAVAELPTAPRPQPSVCARAASRGHPGHHRATALASSSCARDVERHGGLAQRDRRLRPHGRRRRPDCGCT